MVSSEVCWLLSVAAIAVGDVASLYTISFLPLEQGHCSVISNFFVALLPVLESLSSLKMKGLSPSLTVLC